MKIMKAILSGNLIICLILLTFTFKTNSVSAAAAVDKNKPKTGDFISLDIRYSIKLNGKDTVLFDSKNQPGGGALKFMLPPSDFKGDLYEKIINMSVGDSSSFQINADSVFLRTFKMKELPKEIEPNSMLNFYVKLIKIDSPDRLKADEQTSVQKYLKDNNITVTPSKTGVYVVEQTKGEGAKIDSGNHVKLHFIISLVDGTPLFNSIERGEPLKFQYGKKFDTPGIDEAIGTLREGSKAIVIVPSSMGFGDKGQGNLVPPYATIIYNVEIVDVMATAEYEKEQAQLNLKNEQMKETAKVDESAKIQKYLADSKIDAKPIASGLYFIEKIKGTGARAEAGKTVSVHYTGKLLDGTKFDSSVDRNEPFEFILGQGQVIKGWDEGIALMNIGGKATLIIPSNIAYGDRDMGAIPPFSPLVFDVELLGIK